MQGIRVATTDNEYGSTVIFSTQEGTENGAGPQKVFSDGSVDSKTPAMGTNEVGHKLDVIRCIRG